MQIILSFLKTKRLFVTITVVALALLAIWFTFYRKPDTSNSYIMKREDLVNTVLVNGTYTTASQTKVVSPSNGIITKLYIKNNAMVEKSDVLFEVESTASEEEKAKVNSDYQAALAALKNARDTQKSAQSALDKVLDDIHLYQYGNGGFSNVGSANETQAQKTLREQAEATVRQSVDLITAAQADVAAKALDYGKTRNAKVIAPSQGIVANLLKDEGEGVSASEDAPVLIIADFINPFITTSVNEINISRLEIGQKAQILFDSLPDETFSGTVENIDRIGTRVQGAVTYTAKIKVDNLPPNIKPQMTASITIETGRKDNVLTIPNTAIIKKDQKTYVQKRGDKEDVLTEVSLGMKGLTKTEITSGLSEGDIVALSK